MIKENDFLMLPGPTQVPAQILRAMSQPMINHRGSQFKSLLLDVSKNLQQVFKTENEVITLTASGSGGLEAAVVNFVSPGDRVIVASIGNFGERFRKICQKYRAEVDFIDFGWGNAIDPAVIAERLAADTDHQIKAIFCQHNETSTAVVNPIQAISAARGNHPALLIVDSVSGLGAADLRMDEWGLDVVVAGSQKAFMLPPGLAFVAVNQRAWQVAEENTNSKFYFDLVEAKKSLEKGQTPFTPGMTLIYALEEALQMIMAKGIDRIIADHLFHRDIVRAGIKAMGLTLCANDDIASPAVTAILAPEGIDPADIRKTLLDKYSVVVAGGQGKFKDTVFRIGHLGYVQPLDLLAVLAALEMTLISLGLPLELGKGVRAAQQVIFEQKK